MNIIAPGLSLFRNYRREWLSADLVAGLSVAAVALPVGIAYADLAGFPPVVGIYSCILPPVMYALFGSSRQLIVNPDVTAAAIVASTITPLALGNAEKFADLAMVLTLMTGVFLIAGGIAGLGAIANFLSRPILTGYLNGIALTIIVGQLGKLLGYEVAGNGFFSKLISVVSRINQTQLPTAALGLSLLVMLVVAKRVLPRLPWPLVAGLIGAAVVYFLGLTSQGVAIVGAVPAGLPVPHIPSVEIDQLTPLAFGAGGIMLVSFCSMTMTARSFAAKNGYTIDSNRDMVALGICDISAGLSRGFVVSGSDSRTAVVDSSGSKSQMAGIVASAAMVFVLLFLTSPLAYLPITGLSAILISSSTGLFDTSSVRDYFRLSKPEFRQCMVATLGVMTVGVLPGVLVAVGLAIFNLLRKASRPHDAVLGQMPDSPDLYRDVEAGAETIPGIVIFRFDAPIIFFNAEHFAGRVRTVAGDAPLDTKYFLLNAESSSALDVTGAAIIGSMRGELSAHGITLGIARPKGRFLSMLERSGLADEIGRENLFTTVRDGVNAFLEKKSTSQLKASTEYR
ncbi:MAG: SulP family inorganic anion transporter [Pyrinomonadaceae bacterium]